MRLRGWKISEKYTRLLRELWLPESADISYATDLTSPGQTIKVMAEWDLRLKNCSLPEGSRSWRYHRSSSFSWSKKRTLPQFRHLMMILRGGKYLPHRSHRPRRRREGRRYSPPCIPASPFAPWKEIIRSDCVPGINVNCVFSSSGNLSSIISLAGQAPQSSEYRYQGSTGDAYNPDLRRFFR